MNKSSKSRIPVLVTKLKSSNLDEESLEARNNVSKKQVSKTIVYSMQKKTEKINSHSKKSSNLDLKNKLTSLKTSTSTNNNILKENIKSSKNKLTTFKTNFKSNVTNKAITKTINKNINANSRKILSCDEINMKSSVVEDKKENLPSPVSYSFEEEMCTPIGNQLISEQGCFSAQENIEFESNEIFRKMILSNKELSPSMRKLMPCLRLSSFQSERPSIYQKVQIPDDPLKEAVKALENTCLSAKRIKKENKLTLSPCRDRLSIYTPHGDPNKEFLKKLEEFKLKQLQRTAPRSTKKVTFNLNIQEYTPKSFCDIQSNSVTTSEHKLMKINEKSEENTPNSPYNVKSNEIKLSYLSSKHENNDSLNQITPLEKKDSTDGAYEDDAYPECNEMKTVDTISKNNQRTIDPTFDEPLCQNRTTSLLILNNISSQSSSPVFVCDNKYVGKYTNCLKNNNVHPSSQKIIKQSAKVYTPKPISLSSKSKMFQSYSPELLVDGKSAVMTDLAPICTPLVLRNQAKNTMFSPETDEGPIPLKLDFAEEEKNTPKKQISRNPTSFALHNIVTIQQQLDDLADQECNLSLINETFPVICGRYISNPVARILHEGDDMHFIPIRL